ncbi:hypothetical protein [Kocuria rhizophila]|uniref:hypothetical protein n=1 Tax=Kocuria rhizophila TaxID=72000 RepID=UPI001F3A7513|nr:hypothetical protein [Kocuria rhizophila]
MPTSPRHSPSPASDVNDGAGSAVSRRALAKGAAWAAPVILSAAAAPAYAASARDVIVGKTTCVNLPNSTNNEIPFTVQTINNATLPVGTVFKVNYAGGSNRPTWSGALATNSNVVITPGSDQGSNGGRWGAITFTLKNPMPANTTWPLTITMDIGFILSRQETSLELTSTDPKQNTVTSNDRAVHATYLGGCQT